MKQTTNYKLNKVDVAVDGESYFSFKTCLNDNWDKVDTQMKQNATDITTVSTYAQAVNTKANTNTTNIGTLNTSVSGLDSRVTALEQGGGGEAESISNIKSAVTEILALPAVYVYHSSYTGTSQSTFFQDIQLHNLPSGEKLQPYMIVVQTDGGYPLTAIKPVTGDTTSVKTGSGEVISVKFGSIYVELKKEGGSTAYNTSGTVYNYEVYCVMTQAPTSIRNKLS